VSILDASQTDELAAAAMLASEEEMGGDMPLSPMPWPTACRCHLLSPPSRLTSAGHAQAGRDDGSVHADVKPPLEQSDDRGAAPAGGGVESCFSSSSGSKKAVRMCPRLTSEPHLDAEASSSTKWTGPIRTGAQASSCFALSHATSDERERASCSRRGGRFLVGI
jgi:hypothetical protein